MNKCYRAEGWIVPKRSMVHGMGITPTCRSGILTIELVYKAMGWSKRERRLFQPIIFHFTI
ncbi:hypothetical protein DEAC_c01050 [Desulfosporosinus acididurans]|uniref:Uncharacterized protein n=1 Tax=Desulfosporosinus acididurans TaxID=476652 RepID=A0A0J1ISS1_9FIRM|nr:hypothetical protein DEAC_c01050 [Desulfosporosinus acididurans]